MRFLLALPVLLLLVPLALACGGDAGEGGDLDVTLTEWEVNADPETLPEGAIVITVRNNGGEDHELVIIRTNTPVDELPTKEDGSVDEDGAGLSDIKEIEDIGAGDRTGRTYALDPGSYALICNLVSEVDGEDVSHYEKGMRTAFTVTADEG